MKKQVQKLIEVRDQLELLDDEFSNDVRVITDEAHHHIEAAIDLLEVICLQVKP